MQTLMQEEEGELYSKSANPRLLNPHCS